VVYESIFGSSEQSGETLSRSKVADRPSKWINNCVAPNCL